MVESGRKSRVKSSSGARPEPDSSTVRDDFVGSVGTGVRGKSEVLHVCMLVYDMV